MSQHTKTHAFDARSEVQSPNADYLRPREAAAYLGISCSKLAKLRMRIARSDGPRFAKCGGSVIYRRADLDAWMNQLVVGSQ